MDTFSTHRSIPALPGSIGVLDPGSSAFRAIERRLSLEDGVPRPTNPHVEAVVDPICRWAARHGLAGESHVARAMMRARFNVLAAHGHPDTDFEGFLLTTKWCTWLFFQDDWLCDRSEVAGAVLDPATLARAHRELLATLAGGAPDPADPLATSLHEIGRQIEGWAGCEGLERFTATVRDYFWGNEWEALNRVRGEMPSVAAFSKIRPHAGAAYTAFEFWEIVEDYEIPRAAREHAAFQELRLMANNCISWANDLFSLAKEIREGNPNNIVLSLARDERLGLEDAMHATVRMYNREYAAFRQLVADLPLLGLASGELDLRPHADRLHGWLVGSLRWHRLTPRYREGLSMHAGDGPIVLE